MVEKVLQITYVCKCITNQMNFSKYSCLHEAFMSYFLNLNVTVTKQRDFQSIRTLPEVFMSHYLNRNIIVTLRRHN